MTKPQSRRIRRRANMNLAYELSGKPVSAKEGQVISLEVSRAFREKQEREAQLRALSRRPATGDSASVRFAMRCIEERIVKGLWVLEISLPEEGKVGWASRNGLDYLFDRDDTHARYSDAPGGKWDIPEPRPAVPSSKEIDAAKEAKGWIERLDEEAARLLSVAAMTKRGNRKNRVLWPRVVARLPQLRTIKLRTLQDRYDRALREIVAHLTVDRLIA